MEITFCPNCGHQNQPGSRFCEECGCDLIQAASLQYRNTGDRTDRKLPVWWTEYLAFAPCTVRTGQPREIPSAGAQGV